MVSELARLAIAVSGSIPLSIAVKSTVILLLALGATRALRATRASVRHAILASAFAVLLALPIAVIATPPLTIRVPAARDPAITAPVFLKSSELPLAPAADRTHAARQAERGGLSAISTQTFLITAWAAGFVFCVTPLFRGWRELHRLRRRTACWELGRPLIRELAARIGIQHPIEVLVDEEAVVPMTCGWRRPVVVLPAGVDRWSAADVERALVHEFEHVRRGDWIVQIVARVVCALYWFHPLAWAASRSLGLEAECACDDAVLRESDGVAYAQQLIALARRMSSPRAGSAIAMVGTSALSARVSAVLDANRSRGRAGASRIVAVAVAATVMLIVCPLSARPSQSAQTPEPLPEFEVASIKQNNSGDFRTQLQALPNGRFQATNLPVRTLILYAWRVQMFELAGGPGWMATDRFDVAARGPENATVDQVRLMVRALLVDRFKLRTHIETRELPVYAMQMASGDARLGPRLKRNPQCDGAPPPQPPQGPPPDRSHPPCGYFGPSPASDFASGRAVMGFHGVTMDGLARFWAPALQRIVINRTGLDGAYDGEFDPTAEFGPPPPPPGMPDPFDRASFPSAFTVLREQLGLRMESTKAPVAVLVVDSVEKPKEN